MGKNVRLLFVLATSYRTFRSPKEQNLLTDDRAMSEQTCFKLEVASLASRLWYRTNIITSSSWPMTPLIWPISPASLCASSALE